MNPPCSRSIRLTWAFFVGASVCLLAFEANAIPARIGVFEAKVHAEPKVDAQVIHVFSEDEKVSVSEETTDGWRRIRIPGGKAGWISEDAIEIVETSESVSGETGDGEPETPASPPKPDVIKPLIYVKDLAHLAELTASDAIVGPMAEKLERRRTTGFGILIGGTLGGMTAAALGLTVLQSKACIAGPYPDSKEACNSGPNEALLVGGLAAAGVAAIVALLVNPDREDLLDLLNQWNTRHPEDPFTITGGMGSSR